VRKPCSHCGQPVPIIGPPKEQTECPHCMDQFDTRKMWAELLEDFESEVGNTRGKSLKTGGLGGGYTAETRFSLPACNECDEPYAKTTLGASDAQTFTCGKCGAPAGSAPVPKWLRDMVPNARQFYRGGAWAGHQGHAASLEDTAKPVSMSCPECNGALKATAASKRIMTCQYCSAEVYLPDAIWRRLHPVRKMQEWFVRLEGSTPQEKERAWKKKKNEEKRELDQQRKEAGGLREEQEKLERLARVRKVLAPAWIFVLLASLAFVGTTLCLLATREVPLSLIITLAVAELFALWLVSKPLRASGGEKHYGVEWVVFAIHSRSIGSFVPVLGLVISPFLIRDFLRGIHSFTVQTKSNGNQRNRTYDAIQFNDGEGRPAALLALFNMICAQICFVVLVEPMLLVHVPPEIIDLGMRVSALARGWF
jgi:hypothetical protein